MTRIAKIVPLVAGLLALAGGVPEVRLRFAGPGDVARFQGEFVKSRFGSIDIRADGSYDFYSASCRRPFDDVPTWSGRARVDGDRLVFQTAAASVHGEVKACRLYPMIWDGRAYLIPEDLMLTFCERFRSGWRGEGVDGACWFAFRRASSSRAVRPALAGAPPVPREAVKYLSHPFSARVLTATSPEGRYGTVYRIDKGAQDALAFGSLLTSATGRAYRVISVDPTEATIVATGGISNDGVGTVLSPL